MDKKECSNKLLDLVIDSINFIILSYLLVCGLLSFRTSPIWIFLIAANVHLISKFYTNLKISTSSTVKSIVIITGCIIILTTMLLTIGYFPISMVAEKLI